MQYCGSNGQIVWAVHWCFLSFFLSFTVQIVCLLNFSQGFACFQCKVLRYMCDQIKNNTLWIHNFENWHLQNFAFFSRWLLLGARLLACMKRTSILLLLLFRCTSDSLVQFKMVIMRLEKPVCTPPRLSEVSPTLPLKRFQCSNVHLVDDGPLLSFQGRLSITSSFNTAVQQLIRMKLSHTLVSLTSVFSKSSVIKIKAFSCWFD